METAAAAPNTRSSVGFSGLLYCCFMEQKVAFKYVKDSSFGYFYY